MTFSFPNIYLIYLGRVLGVADFVLSRVFFSFLPVVDMSRLMTGMRVEIEPEDGFWCDINKNKPMHACILTCRPYNC